MILLYLGIAVERPSSVIFAPQILSRTRTAIAIRTAAREPLQVLARASLRPLPSTQPLYDGKPCCNRCRGITGQGPEGNGYKRRSRPAPKTVSSDLRTRWQSTAVSSSGKMHGNDDMMGTHAERAGATAAATAGLHAARIVVCTG